MKSYNITVVGSGYVGMAMAVLLAQHNDVIVLDIDADRVKKINKKETTISDPMIEDFLKTKKLSLRATLSVDKAFKNPDFIIVATPTDYDPISNKFDTSSVDSVLDNIFNKNKNKNSFVIIKSTIPIGHTTYLQKKFKTRLICFSPEFLREGDALKDNLYPSRIIIGSKENKAKAFANVLTNSAVSSKIQTLFMSSSEAEAIKLFSNSYLAMRVSFFNELDSFCLVNNMNTKNIIDGVCLDDRIGDGYNNPSFGYGGYCLPKDTKQLLTNFKHTPQNLIEAIVKSNDTRKNFIISIIEKMNIEVIGFYKLSMKKGSDNYRSAAVIDIIEKLKSMNKKIVIYEPEIFELEYSNCSIIRSIDDFKKIAQIVVANRISSEIEDIKDRVFTRDLFNRD